MSGVLAPAYYHTAMLDSGAIAPGAQLFFFLTGSSTPAAVYHDAALATPWTVPAVCDSAGRIVVYLDPTIGALKLVQKDNLGVTFGPTVDPVTPVNAGSSGLGEIFTFGSNSSSPITVTNYASGATFDKLQPGSQVFAVDSATLIGTYVLRATGLQTVSGTLTVAIVDLTSGAPDTPLATCAITSTTGQVVTSSAITFGVSGTVRNYGIKCKVTANTGFLIGASLIRTA
jgi:hypothetical protein